MNMSFWKDELADVRTNKKKFLDTMNLLVPWKEWVEIVKPVYPKGERGNKPYDLILMLRIFVLQNLYDMADMKTMDEIADSRAFGEFCMIESSNQIPNGDTIGLFRNLLEKNGLQVKFFENIRTILEAKGLILKKGTIIDSTISTIINKE